jgi:hypothetical protein
LVASATFGPDSSFFVSGFTGTPAGDFVLIAFFLARAERPVAPRVGCVAPSFRQIRATSSA